MARLEKSMKYVVDNEKLMKSSEEFIDSCKALSEALKRTTKALNRLSKSSIDLKLVKDEKTISKPSTKTNK